MNHNTRKIVTLLAMGLFVLLLAVSAAGSAVAEEPTPTQESSVTSDVENVDQNETFGSIQAAIDNASAGETIEVESGTFEESVVIDTADLTLTAAAAADPVVVGQSKRAVGVRADGVTVSELSIQNPVGAGDDPDDIDVVGLRVDDQATGVTVENNTITDIGTAANTNARGLIGYSGADGLAVRNNEITNISGTQNTTGQSHAIQLFESSGPESAVTGLEIVDNTIENVSDRRSAVGIHLNGDISGTIADNDVRAVGESNTGFTDGIFLGAGSAATSPPDNVTITNNTLDDIEGAIVRTITLENRTREGPEDILITKNSIDNVESTGQFQAAALFVGAYKDLGDDHAFTQNDILDGAVTRSANQSAPIEFIKDPEADALDARGNWWGNETGPGGAGNGTGQPVLPDPVDRFGADDPELGVRFRPYLEAPVGQSVTSVEAELADANPGDTIELSPGVYRENVVVDVPGVTIRGPNAGPATNAVSADATGSQSNPALIDPSASDSGAALTVAADGVTVDGVQIATAGQDGIAFSKAVDDVTIANNQITRVGGGTFGSNNGPRAAGNGINLQFTDSSEATSSNVTIRDNLISDITTPDTEARTTAVGVQVLPRGNDVVDLTIINNTIRNVTPGASANFSERARAVALHTQRTNGTGVVTNPTIAGNRIENVSGEKVRVIALFGSGDPAVGPRNFTIAYNDFDELNSSGGFPPAAIYAGAYKNFGDDHAFTNNNVRSGVVTRWANESDPPGFIQDPATDALNATNNWWGDPSGPSGAGDGTGQPVSPDPAIFGFPDSPEIAVEFDPFLELPEIINVPEVDVNGDGVPATDTTGDQLLNDVRGDGGTGVFDVQTLFLNLDRTEVQNNAQAFNFQGGKPNEVTVFDVQKLFTTT